jgi:hypothetical protein
MKKRGARGIGPEWGFITTLLKNDPDMKIGIIKIPVSGSNIECWINDKTLPRGGGDYYDNVVETVLEARKHGVLKGFLWHQGESNGGSSDYDQLFERMVEGYRKAFGEEDLPVIAGTVGEDGGKSSRVNDGLKKAAKKMNNVKIVSSVRTLADNVHYDADSQDELGRRYANAYLAMTGKQRKLIITTTQLPEGRAGCYYVAEITASGGDGSHRFWKAGGLPDGMTLQNGFIEGRLPANPQSIKLTVEVTDNSGTATADVTIPVTELPKDRVEIVPDDSFSLCTSASMRGSRELLLSPNWKHSAKFRAYVKFTIPPNWRDKPLKELRLPVIMSGGPFPVKVRISILSDPSWKPAKLFNKNNPMPQPETIEICMVHIDGPEPTELVLPLPGDLDKHMDNQGRLAFEIKDVGTERGGMTFLSSHRAENPPKLVVQPKGH